MANRDKRLLGIIGWPLTYTFSPAMHNAALAALGLDYRYEMFPIEPAALAVGLDELKQKNMCGFNVTIPHKTAIIPYLDSRDPFAERVGAVNTVVVTADGQWVGHNTDAVGFTAGLKEKVPDINYAGKKVVLLGAGGAANAAADALAASGIAELMLYDLDATKSEGLAKRVRANHAGLRVSLLSERSELEGEIRTSDIIVNATPVGMKEHDPLLFSPQALSAGKIFYDIIYTRRTEMMQAAEEHGCRVVGGLGMLLYQGYFALRLWIGMEPSISIMRTALEEELSSKR